MPADPLSLLDTAARLGQYRWADQRLFEILGEWGVTTPELEVKALLATFSAHHAWRAEQWLARMPELREVDSEALTVPPGPRAAEAFEVLAAADTTVTRLAGVVRVALPRAIAVHDDHLARCTPVADAPLARSLRMVLDDEVMSAGDFVRNMKQLVDLLRQIAAAAPTADLATTAHEAVGRVQRGLVLASTVVAT